MCEYFSMVFSVSQQIKRKELHLIYKCKNKEFGKEQEMFLLKPRAFIYLVIHEVRIAN